MKVITIHSFRGGTGKSTISSNISAYLAALGNKVLLIDTDIRSPGVHAIFGMHEDSFDMTFNDYLSGECDLDEVVYDVTKQLKLKRGSLYLVPSCIEYDMIATTLISKQSHKLMQKAIEKFGEEYDLDYIIVDTHPGINEEVLITADLADVNFIIARPDNQDFQGLRVSTSIFHKMDLSPKIILNKVHKGINPKNLVKKIEKLFDTKVAGVLPFSEEVMIHASKSVFYKKFPKHAFTKGIKKIVASVATTNKK